jgi:hypothetical protein
LYKNKPLKIISDPRKLTFFPEGNAEKCMISLSKQLYIPASPPKKGKFALYFN